MDKRTGRDQWINARMRKLLAEDFCPACGKHNVLHNDKQCTMRYVKETGKRIAEEELACAMSA